MNLSIVILNDTGTVHQWIVSGTSANVTLTITSAGLHQLAYWSIDKAGNKETPHTTKFDLVRADVDDHLRSCDTSKIDHDDIRDSPSVKLHDVQEKQAACHKDKNPDITTDQPNGLAGQSWLDQNLANMLLAIFKIISNLSTLVLSAS